MAVTVRRRVAPGGGGAGPAPTRGALLRPLRPRRGHPRHPRPPAAHVPGAHVLGPQARPPHQAGQALPAVPHRAVLGPVHRGGRPRALRRHGGRPHGVPGRGHRRGRAPPRGRDGGGRRRPRLRARRPAARPAAHVAHGVRAPAGGDRASRGPRRGGHRRGPPRGGGVRLPRAPGPDRGPAGLRGGQGGGPHAAPAGGTGPRGALRRRRARRPPPPRQVARVRGGDSSGWTSGAGDPETWGTEGAGRARCAPPGARARPPRRRRGLRAVPGRPARRPGGPAGAAAGRQAHPACRP